MSSDPSSDKDAYSVQEMMERLRQDGGKGGPRRRRSVQQKIVTKKRRRFGLLLVFLVMAAILGSIVVFGMLNRARVEGEIFRQSANQQLSTLAGASVDCDRFRPEGWYELLCPNVHVKAANGVLKDFVVKDLDAGMTTTSFFRDEWDIVTLTMGEAKLNFLPQPATSEAATPPAPVNLAHHDGFRFGISATPAVVSVHSFACPNCTLSWPAGEEALNQVEGLGVRGSYTDQLLRLEASAGRWTGGIWADVPVENLSLKYQAGHAEIENVRLRFGAKNQLRAQGNIDFTAAGPSGELTVKLDPMPLPDLISATWSRRLQGRLNTTNVKYTILPNTPDTLTGDFSMDGLIADKFPGLKALGAFFKNELYTKLEFRQISGSFRWTPESLIIENFKAVRHGECKLSGTVELKRTGALSGKLQLALNTLESGLPQFSGQEDGLDLIDFTLSGTETDPQDSLTKLFQVEPASPTPP